MTQTTHMETLKTVVVTFILLSCRIVFPQTSWESINFPDSLNIQAINAEIEGVIFVSTGGNNEYKGLFRSHNSGESWEELTIDTTVPFLRIYTIEYDNYHSLYLGTNEKIYRSYNNGDNFEKIFEGANNITCLNFNSDNHIYAGGWQWLIRSEDYGETWDTIYNGGFNSFSDIGFGNNGEIYAVGRDFYSGSGGGGFYRSIDNGISWENTLVLDVGANSISVNTNGTINVDGCFISDDNGLSWTNNNGVYSQVIEKDQYEHLFAGTISCKVWISENWGNSWTDITNDLDGYSINQISISNSNTIYIQSKKSQGIPQLSRSINPILLDKPSSLTQEITIHPVPSELYLKVYSNINNNIQEIKIFSINGNIEKDRELINNTIDISDLSGGIYFLHFKLMNETKTIKFIKK